MRKHAFETRLFLFLSFFILSACESPPPVETTNSDPPPATAGSVAPGPSLVEAPILPAAVPPESPVEILPSATEPSRKWTTDVLLFSGDGSWASGVSSLQDILVAHAVTYERANSYELEAMSAERLSSFGAVVWPGGSGGTQYMSLSPEARLKLRNAVQQDGVGWIGFCAGAFVAVAPPGVDGGVPSYGFGIVEGPELEYYAREEYYARTGGTDIEIVQSVFSDGRKRDLVWYGGPVTPEVPNGVVARYPDGTAAISQIFSGKGFVLLSGPHPEAPIEVRDQFGLEDADGLDFDIAWELIDAVLKRRPLSAFP